MINIEKRIVKLKGEVDITNVYCIKKALVDLKGDMFLLYKS